MPAGASSSPHLWVELNVLNLVGALPELEGARVARAGTTVYDLTGEPLFLRVRLEGGDADAFADTAVDPRMGAPLLAVSYGEWDPDDLLDEAAEILRERRKAVTYDEARFVAFSYPKLAIQFLRDEREVALLELYSWRQVPAARERKRDEPPGDFDRWSFLEEQPPALLRRNAGRHAKRVRELEKLLRGRQLVGRRLIDADLFGSSIDRIDVFLRDTRELHYSAASADHHPCYELRGQQTSVWCVAASVQMLLDFYRYNYPQTRIASELGLGTVASPTGLPYGNEQLVVDKLESLTSNALTAGMNWTPSWTQFRTEISANRPLISFIPGHSRTVAGYLRSGLSSLSPFRGLLVYDPWPPTTGVITRWENFDAQTYRVTFNAQLTLV
jgi:peptidase C39-like protein